MTASSNPTGGHQGNVGSNYNPYVIVKGRNKEERPTDGSGNCSVVKPTTQSQNGYPLQDLPFITMVKPPTAQAACETNWPPDLGSIAYVMEDIGNPTNKICIGIANAELSSDQGIPGNHSPGDYVKDFSGKENPRILSKPDLRETQNLGATVKEAVNKGLFKLSNLKGLPTHGALKGMVGHIHEQVKNIETAVQQFSQIPGLGFKMPSFGSAMKMGDIKNKMNKQQKKKLEDSLPPEILDALDSLLNYLSESSSDSFVCSGNIHEETFIENAVDLLSKVTNMEELFEVIYNLRSNTALHGLDKFKELEIKVQTPYGEMELNVDSSGNIGFNANSAAKMSSALSSLSSLMNGIQTASLDKLFGDAAETMSKMFSRIPGNARNALVKTAGEKHKNSHVPPGLKVNKGNYPWT